SGPPTAESIRALDQRRMLQDPLLTDESSEEDLTMARALLEEKSPEELAAALVRVYRSRLPAPEDVFDPGAARPREARAPRQAPGDRREGASAGPPGDRVWFRLDIGRANNADPKWLLPMICRRGKITRQDIGAIRVFERETKFEVAAEAAARFAA